jgi:hypothetical protein
MVGGNKNNIENYIHKYRGRLNVACIPVIYLNGWNRKRKNATKIGNYCKNRGTIIKRESV